MPTAGRHVSRRETVVSRRFHPGARRDHPSRHNQEPCRTPTNRAVLLSSTPHRTAPCSSVLPPPLLRPADPPRAGTVSGEVVGWREAERAVPQRPAEPSACIGPSRNPHRRGVKAVAGSHAWAAEHRGGQFRPYCTGHGIPWSETFLHQAKTKIIIVPDWFNPSPGQ